MDRDGEDITVFVVGASGTLTIAGYPEAKIRAEFYEDVVDQWRQSPKDLLDATLDCEPLAWAIHAIYSEFRDDLQAELDELTDEEDSDQAQIATLHARLESMPEEPYDGADDWLLSLTEGEFESRVVPQIAQWFAEEPDWSFEDDHLPQTGTAQGAALGYFQSMDGDELDLLGVTIVEGACPGSTYNAAELEGKIDEANRAAETAGIPVRFKPE